MSRQECGLACRRPYLHQTADDSVTLQVLSKKKADLMKQYASESVLREQQEAKELLNIKS